MGEMRRKYRYPKGSKTYELTGIRGCVYLFKCGHWCTDSVFEDLIDVKTGIPNWMQPKLF